MKNCLRMSNQFRKGKRLSLKQDRVKAKQSYKDAKDLINTLDEISEILYSKDIEITEDNLVEEVGKVSDIKVERLEKTYILSKLESLKNG